jgi:LTXXQ motif family protein
MKSKSKMLIGGLALAALGAASFAAVAGHRGHHGWGDGERGHGWGHHRKGGKWGGRHGRRGSFMGKGLRVICRRNGEEKVDHMLVRIKHKVDVTDAQMPAYEEFASTVRTAAAKVKEACPPKPAWRERGSRSDDSATNEAATPPKRPSPIERLARAETMMVAALEGIRTVRPVAEKFYATLSDEQKAKFTERRHHKRWGKRGRGHGKKWRHRGSRSDDRGSETEAGPSETKDTDATPDTE